MSLATFIMLTSLAIGFMAWYANASKRDKILCRFRRINKTMIAKFVKMSARHVIFDKKKFLIVPSCCVQQWYNSGFIHMIFPQWVQTLDFTHESRWPLDPNTLKPMEISPEYEYARNNDNWASSFAKHNTPVPNKKKSMLQEYLPWVAILLVVLVGFWLYNNMSVLAVQMQLLQNSFNAMAK